MTIKDILYFVFGGAGVLGWYMTVRSIKKDRHADKVEEITKQELLPEKGAVLLMEASGGALRLFEAALAAAREAREADLKVIQELRAENELMRAELRAVRARLTELEGKS